MTQFHFDPSSYLQMIRAEVPVYDELQNQLADVLTSPVSVFLDLGAGTGMTTHAVLRRFPHASVVLLDESAAMVEAAQRSLPSDRIAATIVGDLLNDLPTGPFDAVVSALAVHHLDAHHKKLLFGRLRALLPDGGQFVMADVVLPTDPHDAVTPLTPDFDYPEDLTDLTTWLRQARFNPSIVWSWKDLAVVSAT
jgi:tRNA (cmo5U34)-methyltransferase